MASLVGLPTLCSSTDMAILGKKMQFMLERRCVRECSDTVWSWWRFIARFH